MYVGTLLAGVIFCVFLFPWRRVNSATLSVDGLKKYVECMRSPIPRKLVLFIKGHKSANEIKLIVWEVNDASNSRKRTTSYHFFPLRHTLQPVTNIAGC